VVEVAGGGGDAGVAELAGDDGYVDALRPELHGVGVAEAVGVDAFVDAGASGQAFEQDAGVGVAHRLASQRAEDVVAAARTEAGAGVQPPFRECGVGLGIAGGGVSSWHRPA